MAYARYVGTAQTYTTPERMFRPYEVWEVSEELAAKLASNEYFEVADELPEGWMPEASNGGPVAQAPEEPSKKWNKTRLTEYATSNGIEVDAKWTKAEILEAITASKALPTEPVE